MFLMHTQPPALPAPFNAQAELSPPLLLLRDVALLTPAQLLGRVSDSSCGSFALSTVTFPRNSAERGERTSNRRNYVGLRRERAGDTRRVLTPQG